jgi:hypothetical protein
MLCQGENIGNHRPDYTKKGTWKWNRWCKRTSSNTEEVGLQRTLLTVSNEINLHHASSSLQE